MTGNTANLTPAAPRAGGGAVFSTSSGSGITVTGSTLTGNSATIAEPTGSAFGGAALYLGGTGRDHDLEQHDQLQHHDHHRSGCCDGGAVYQVLGRCDQRLRQPPERQPLRGDRRGPMLQRRRRDLPGRLRQRHDHDHGSSLNGNTAAVTDSGCCDGGGALVQDISGLLILTDTQLNDDTTSVTTSGGCCGGGGAVSTFTPITATNATLDGNTANVTGGSCCGGGGAVLLGQRSETR